MFDLVSWASETYLLRQARASGASTVSGLWLLVHNTALMFEKWTGHRPSTREMRTFVSQPAGDLYAGASELYGAHNKGRDGIGHLTRQKTGQLSNRKIPQMSDVSAELLRYAEIG